MAKIPHVVCLGGGYVAIRLAQSLRKPIERGELRLTVIDRNNFQTFGNARLSLFPNRVRGRCGPQRGTRGLPTGVSLRSARRRR